MATPDNPEIRKDFLDDFSLSEEREVSMEDEEIERENRREDLEGKRQDRHQRKTFAVILYIFMCVYMAAALAVVFFCGFGLMRLSDTVLVTLLTTTLADVIGVFSFVAKYLFPQKESPKA